MKKFKVSYFGYNAYTGKHEVSIYENIYFGGYSIYVDDTFWTDIDALYEFEDELSEIESYYNCKFGFLGF